MILILFSKSAHALDSDSTVASLSCSFEQKLFTTNLISKDDGYLLKINSDNAFFPSFLYEATLIKVDSKLFVFKGSPAESVGLPIDIVLNEKNNPGKLCGAVQLLDSSGLTVGGTLGCCKYVKQPSNQINFEVNQ